MSVRKFTWDDLPTLLDFITSLQSNSQPANSQPASGQPDGSEVGNGGRDLRRQTFQQLLSQPGQDPEENCLLLEDRGRLKGQCLIFPEIPLGRAVLALDVAHDLMGGPVERELILRAVDRAGELGARVAHVCVADGSPRGELLEQAGFSRVRDYWLMLWSEAVLPQANLPDGFSVRSFRPGDAPVLTEIQNAAFTGSWGFCPNTVEQIEYRSSMANTSHQGILLLHDADAVAGYCWTCLARVGDKTRGIIGMIGVAPAYRGRRVSHNILLAGMQYLQSSGIDEIGLEVDGNNTPAIRLYASVGFRQVGELHWYELALS